MNLLIKQSKIVDPSSPFNGKTVDVHIVDGIIRSIGKKLSVPAAKSITGKQLHLSPGWVDVFADFADPGYEQRETLQSGAAAAAAGGFTDVCLVPNTQPAMDQKSVIEYLLSRANGLPITVHPLGAITKNAAGKELAEIYDMKRMGAIAFTDGKNAVQSSDIMVKALQYIKPFGGLIIQIPDNKDIQPGGFVHEGIVSTQLGLPAKPAIAEELLIDRDIKLAAYAQSRLHITGISTATALKQVKAARQRKTDITSSVTPYHLFFTDADLHGYDSNLKVNPHLRGADDRKALQKGIEDGSIDCITTHHMPYDTDHKMVEFEYAKYGMIGLQTAYAAVNTALPTITQDRWVELLAINPRKILGLPIPTIQEGAPASLTLFSPSLEWTPQAKDFFSKSKNSAFINKPLTGKPLGIIHNRQTNL